MIQLTKGGGPTDGVPCWINPERVIYVAPTQEAGCEHPSYVFCGGDGWVIVKEAPETILRLMDANVIEVPV